jgi:hypothetical protein
MAKRPGFAIAMDEQRASPGGATTPGRPVKRKPATRRLALSDRGGA